MGNTPPKPKNLVSFSVKSKSVLKSVLKHMLFCLSAAYAWLACESLIVGFNGVLTPIFSGNVVVSLCHYISRVHSNFSQKRSVFN